jgi:hypothetical protein
MMGLQSILGIATRSGLFGRKRHSAMSLLPALPVGGLLPLAAYVAWKNRDKIRGLVDRVIHRHAPAAAAA